MPQMVSKAHKKLIERIRNLFPLNEVIGWPGAEVNLGKVGGMSGIPLRADIFIVISDTKAVVVEYQSEIHSLKESNSWHNKDDIAGRDDLKRQLCAQLGIPILEITPEKIDIDDLSLVNEILRLSESSHINYDVVREDIDRIKSMSGFLPVAFSSTTGKMTPAKLNVKPGKLINRPFSSR